MQEQWVDLDDGAPAPHQTEQMDDRSCPFSALSASATLPATGPVLVLDPPMSARWADQGFTHHTAGFHWRYDARGPPAFS